MKSTSNSSKILSIDIGGSTIKATILGKDGNVLQQFQKLKTPMPSTPAAVLATIKQLTKDFPAYDMISVGFPGYVKKGIVFTAPNLGTPDWQGVNLSRLINDALKKPTRVVNDADLHGLGVVSGKGLELVITLGTGFGTAMFLDGVLLPHLEMAHHPVTKNKTYDQYVGKVEFKKIGVKEWNKRVKGIIENLKTVFNYDRLYIGGGNASELNIPPTEDIILIDNEDGIRGGAKLWRLDENIFTEAQPAKKKAPAKKAPVKKKAS